MKDVLPKALPVVQAWALEEAIADAEKKAKLDKKKVFLAERQRIKSLLTRNAPPEHEGSASGLTKLFKCIRCGQINSFIIPGLAVQSDTGKENKKKKKEKTEPKGGKDQKKTFEVIEPFQPVETASKPKPDSNQSKKDSVLNAAKSKKEPPKNQSNANAKEKTQPAEQQPAKGSQPKDAAAPQPVGNAGGATSDAGEESKKKKKKKKKKKTEPGGEDQKKAFELIEPLQPVETPRKREPESNQSKNDSVTNAAKGKKEPPKNQSNANAKEKTQPAKQQPANGSDAVLKPKVNVSCATKSNDSQTSSEMLNDNPVLVSSTAIKRKKMERNNEGSAVKQPRLDIETKYQCDLELTNEQQQKLNDYDRLKEKYESLREQVEKQSEEKIKEDFLRLKLALIQLGEVSSLTAQVFHAKQDTF